MLKAVIFDFDGVICDTEMLHFQAFNEVLSIHNFQIDKQDYYGYYLGFSDKDCFKELINKGLLDIDLEEIDSLEQQKKVVFKNIASQCNELIDGVSDFLQILKQHNLPLAICSGALASEIKMILKNTDLSDYFEVIISAEDVEKGKPDPQGFILTLSKLNLVINDSIASNECVVVEDSHWGLQAAKNAGMHTIAVTNSYDPEKLSGAEIITARLNDLKITDIAKLCL